MSLAIVGGYRLVRKLGEGPKAVTWLGHPLDESTASAVKLYRDSDVVGPSREMEALARAAGAHVVAVLDVCTSADGRVALVLERLRAESLATLLGTRSRGLRPGEVVTVLAPLAEAIERMHRAGVTHGAIRPSAVGFTDEGAPVLACFGSAEASPAPTTPVDRERGRFRGDRDAFLALARGVLESVVGSGAVVEWLAEREDEGEWLGAFSARLFAWAAPEPIAFGRADSPEARPVEPVPRRPRAPAQPLLRVVDSLAAAVSGERLEWLRRHASSVRPRFWIAGGGVVAALVLAVTLIPVSAGEDTASVPAPHPSTTDSPPSDASTPPSAIEGDDPAEAALALLKARDRCIRELSILCLDAVDQEGSDALTRDRDTIRSVQSGVEAPILLDAATAVVEERLGGTALVVVTDLNGEPASLLLMRSEAGWRIRDYVDG